MRITAIVPMRHHSERVPGKNYRLLGNEPLFVHIVSALLSCDVIHEVAIDTDSSAVREIASTRFPNVRIIDRPAHLRSGSTPMNDVLLNTVQFLEADAYLQTHSTNPFLSEDTLRRALTAFTESTCDSLFSVTERRTRFWTPDGKPVNHDPRRLLRTQDLDPLLEENSCIYIFTRKTIQETGNRIGQDPLIFPMDQMEALDIDTEADFQIAECLHRVRSHE